MTLLQLLKMQKPEWLWLLIGIIGFIITGSITPTFALYYGEIFKVSFTKPAVVQVPIVVSYKFHRKFFL